jgi:hypothetical protein
MTTSSRSASAYMSTYWRLASMLALCTGAASGCAQHRVATSFAELEKSVKPGRTVYVTGMNGDIRKGKLERLTGANAAVRVSGATVDVLERETVKIEVPESLWQGAAVGAVVGALLGAAGEQAAEVFSFCLTEELTACESGMPLRGLAMGGGLGAAIGAGLDALVWKRTRVFAAPRTGKGVMISPIAGAGGIGLRLTARF